VAGVKLKPLEHPDHLFLEYRYEGKGVSVYTKVGRVGRAASLAGPRVFVFFPRRSRWVVSRK